MIFLCVFWQFDDSKTVTRNDIRITFSFSIVYAKKTKKNQLALKNNNKLPKNNNNYEVTNTKMIETILHEQI